MKEETKFPVRVSMSAQALNELHSCEYGSYEDHIARPGERHHRADIEDTNEDGSRCGEYANGKLHIVEIIERSPYKTVVYLQNQEEVDEFFDQSMSGTWSLHCLGTAIRIWKQLSTVASPEVVKRNPIGLLGY